jgi:uncharacterized protein (DUF302 family)
LFQHPDSAPNLAESLSGSEKAIVAVCNDIKSMLLEKNRKYGDSALNPLRIFSKADTFEQIKVRMDDKLNRIKNAQSDEDEDVILDLLGYLILYRVAKSQHGDQ